MRIDTVLRSSFTNTSKSSNLTSKNENSSINSNFSNVNNQDLTAACRGNFLKSDHIGFCGNQSNYNSFPELMKDTLIGLNNKSCKQEKNKILNFFSNGHNNKSCKQEKITSGDIVKFLSDSALLKAKQNKSYESIRKLGLATFSLQEQHDDCLINDLVSLGKDQYKADNKANNSYTAANFDSLSESMKNTLDKINSKADNKMEIEAQDIADYVVESALLKYDQSDLTSSENLLNFAVEIYDQNKGPVTSPLLADGLNCLGLIYDDKESSTIALCMYKKALDAIEKVKNKPPRLYGIINYNIGRTLYEQGNDKEAVPYLRKAEKLISENSKDKHAEVDLADIRETLLECRAD